MPSAQQPHDLSTSLPLHRILLTISTLSAGGAERVASEMVNHWAARGRTVGLLTLAATDLDHYSLDPRVKRVGLDLIWDSNNPWHGFISNLRRIQMIRQATRTFSPDVVISFIEQTNVRVLAALIGTGIPVIVSERVDPRMVSIGRVWEWARRILYPLSAALVVQTRAVTDWAEKLVPSHKVRTIPNCVSHLPDPASFSERAPVVLAVGRLVAQKGFDILIRSFALSQARRKNWKLIILGEGEERSNLEALVRKEGLQEQIELLGVVGEPWKWFNQARVFVLSSRFEGFPNVLIEAMAMGCPAVATDCPSGPGEIIRHGQNGMLVPVDDIDALTAALDELTENPDLGAQLALEAIKVREKFAADKILAQWDELIHAAVNNGVN